MGSLYVALARIPCLFIGAFIAHCSLELLGSSSHLTVAGTTILCGYIWPDTHLFIYLFIFDTGSCSVTQAGVYCSLNPLGSGDPPALASHVAEATGMPHHTWLTF